MAGFAGGAFVHQPRPGVRAPPRDTHRRAGPGQLRAWRGSYDDYLVQKKAALEAEATAAALFDKKLAQEEVWIRQGIEARRTRNEGRVRALKPLRVQRSERRERIGQMDVRAQDAAQSGQLCSTRSASRMPSARRR